MKIIILVQPCGQPRAATSGRQYHIGEKPSVILYTYINLHGLQCSDGLQCSNMVLYGLREIKVKLNSY